MRRQLWCLALLAMLLGLTANLGSAQGIKGNKQEEDALFKNAQAFVDAFHKGDAKVLAAFWTEDGDYTDQSGKHIKGRKEIEKVFHNFFAEHKGLKVRIEIDSLRFITPDVAVEDGTTEVMTPDGAPPSRARYTIVHAKKDGEWRLASVRDATFSPPTNYEHLRDLEWLIGDWATDNPKGDVARFTFAWGPNQNFIVAHFTTTFKNISIGGGTQWIGYDAAAKHVRSWTFDDNGGFGEASWTRDGNKSTSKTKYVLRDGKTVTATNIIARVDRDTVDFHSTDRTVDGKAIEDGKEIRLKRVK